MLEKIDLPADPVPPRSVWLGILIFVDMGWMFFDRSAYHPENMSVDYSLLLAGRGCAPEQFRVGVLAVASIIHHHSSFSFQQVILGSDFFCACATSVLLFYLLCRLIVRNISGSQTSSSLAAALLTLLTVVNLHWTFYLVRPDTLPGTLFVCISVLLFDALASAKTTRSSVVFVLFLILLAIGQSFCRADLPFCIAAGETLFALFFIPPEARSRRTAFVIAGLVSGICVVLIQLYLMKVRYPLAHYCGDVYTYKHNIVPISLVIGGLFLAPVVVGGAMLLKHFKSLDSAGRALLLAAFVHLPLYFCVGNVTETRIFVPFAMALSPWIAIVGARMLSDADPVIEHLQH